MLIIMLMLTNELTVNENTMPMHRMEMNITIISGLGFVPSLGSCFAGLSARQKIYKIWGKTKTRVNPFTMSMQKNTG